MRNTVITLVLIIALIVCLILVAMPKHTPDTPSDEASPAESDAPSTPSVPSVPSDDTSDPTDGSDVSGGDDDASADISGDDASDDVSGDDGSHDISFKSNGSGGMYLVVDGVTVTDEVWSYIMPNLCCNGRDVVFARKGSEYYFIYNDDLSRESARFEAWEVRTVGDVTVTCELDTWLDSDGFKCIGEPRAYLYRLVKDGKEIANTDMEPVYFRDHIIINPIIVGVADVISGAHCDIYGSDGVLRNDEHGVARVDEKSDYIITYDEKLVPDDGGDFMLEGERYTLVPYHSVLSSTLETVYTSEKTLSFDDLGRVCVYDEKTKTYTPVKELYE